MKKLSKAVVIAVASTMMFSGMTVAAQAHSPNAERAAAIAAFKISKAEFKAAMVLYKATKLAGQDEYKAAMAAWRAANADLITAIKAVKDAYKAALQAAKTTRYLVMSDELATVEQKAAAIAAFEVTKANAEAVRDAALLALGTLPEKPAKPVFMPKPMKPVKPKK